MAGGNGVYESLGIRPVINAGGNTTLWGGSTPSPQVRRAMDEAENSYVEMKELLDRSGQYIADTLGVEGAHVTSGCAAALVLSTAACITGGDSEKIGRLPDTTGMKNEVVFQRQQEYPYRRSFTVPGPKLVWAGDHDSCTEAQLEAAIGPDTAAVAYVYHAESFRSNLTVEDVVRIAHSKGVPVIVDAAGQVYPLDRFRWIAQAADLVCFGAKYVGAPHSTGFACGRGDLVEAVTAHGFIGFETGGRRSLGRGYKVDRQEVAGVVAAMDEWFSMDHEERILGYGEKLDPIERALSGIPGVSTELRRYDSHYQMGLHISFVDPSPGRDVQHLADRLLDGEPRIRVRLDADDTIAIIPHTLMDGEELIVAERLQSLLSQ